MLQPLQLKDVLTSYANEIAELRDFFQKADCVLETANSLHAIASRLQRDRAFHRDLTSYIWVVVHSCNRIISYAELLGLLSIAAAGTRFAAEAHEDDAHTLLHFVMEARQSLNETNKQKNVPSTYLPVSLPVVRPQPVQPIVVREHTILHPQVHPLPVEFSSLEAEDIGGLRRRFIWIAACALAALSIVLVLHHRTTPDKASSQAATVPVAKGTSASMASKENTTPSLRSGAPMVAIPSSTTKRLSSALLASQARSSHETPLNKTPVPAYPAAFLPPVTTAAIATAPTTASNVSPLLVPHSAPTPALAVKNVPAVTSVVRPGSSSSTNSSAPDLSNTTRERHVPRLLRRTPEEQVELAESTRPSDIATSKDRPNATINTPRGTVQAISLGTNAANVLYSPTPAYPLAASAAHVQGEVKLQANVDREGNVAFVRVISGPPLLREAALDAAQRWRYRPDVAAGEPIPMSAITVFEFQLP